MSKKMLSQIRNGLDALGVTVLSSRQGRKHHKIRVLHTDGREQQLTVSITPTNVDHTIDNVMQNVKRFARGQYF